jgi:multidrug efflux pump subunit AcrA (membrane-fusion protein)
MLGKKKRNGKTVLFLLTTLLAFLTYFIATKHKKTQPTSSKIPVIAPSLTELSVIQIAKKTTQAVYEFPARTVPFKVADIRPQVSGVVVKRMFEEGSFVKKGQKLYQIDPVEKITITSPISGYISRSFITDGALVTQNQANPLATVVQIDPIYVDIPISNEQFQELKRYGNLQVRLFTEGAEYAYKGAIKFSEVVVNPNTDTVTVRTQFQNPHHQLLSGMYVNAHIVANLRNTISVPQRIVSFTSDGKQFVWVVDTQNKLEQRFINIGNNAGNEWVVKNGLKEGDLVLYEGFLKVQNGMSIQPKILEKLI